MTPPDASGATVRTVIQAEIIRWPPATAAAVTIVLRKCPWPVLCNFNWFWQVWIDFDRFWTILPDLDQFEGCMSFALMIDNLRLQKRRTGFFKTALLCYTPGPSVTLYRPFSTIVPHKYLLKPIHLFLVLWQDSHLQLSIVIETNVHVRVLNRLRDHLENHWSNPMVTKFFDKKRGKG